MLLIAMLALVGSPAGLPPAIAAQIERAVYDETAQPGPLPKNIHRIDVNHDGIADWHVDFEAADTVAWCGSGGCRHQLYVSQKSGDHVLAFDENARTFAVRRGRVLVDIYGSYCGTAGVVECRRSFVWSARELRLVPIADPRQDPRLFGPLFQPVPIVRADWPAAVAAAVAERAAACAAAGATLDEGDSAVVRSPDLDGDDVEDWIIGSPWSACLPADDMPEATANAIGRPLLTILSGGADPQAVILQSATSDYVVDITTRPARLILMPDQDTRLRECPDKPTGCVGTELNYDPEKRSLEPFTLPRDRR